MSDTPRTDRQELAYHAEDRSTYVHTTFARKLERENNELQQALEQVIQDRDAYHDENAELLNETAELLKDKERLDWILEHCDVGYDNFYKTSFENRDEIDEVIQMEELI